MSIRNAKDEKTYQRGKELMSKNNQFYPRKIDAVAQIADNVCIKEFQDNRDRIICSVGVHDQKKKIEEKR
jgi:hypothetical protein